MLRGCCLSAGLPFRDSPGLSQLLSSRRSGDRRRAVAGVSPGIVCPGGKKRWCELSLPRRWSSGLESHQVAYLSSSDSEFLRARTLLLHVAYLTTWLGLSS